MNSNFFNMNQKFTLHEGKVCEIKVLDSNLLFMFKDKLIIEHGLEFNAISIRIQDLDYNAIYTHFDAIAIKHSRVREISFEELLKLLQTKYLIVYLDFYSFFSNSLLIKGTIDSMEIEITVSEIEDITLLCDSIPIDTLKI